MANSTGVAPTGGNIGVGAIFSLNIGLPRPLPAVSGLYPPSGAAGQKVLLWGNYLLGATAVSFNGVPAPYIGVTSAQSVYATVPAGRNNRPSGDNNSLFVNIQAAAAAVYHF